MDTPQEPRPVDLRERRKRETRAQVSVVSLRLFEDKGVAGTTVDEIAAAAGISPRTFFRHFATKEDAGLVGYMNVEDAIDDLDLSGSDPATALLLIQDMYASILTRLADDDSEYFAVQRLIAREPSLQMAADKRLRASTDRLRLRLTDAFGADRDLTARLLVQVSNATLHAALEAWCQDPGTRTSPTAAEQYQRACRELRLIVGAA